MRAIDMADSTVHALVVGGSLVGMLTAALPGLQGISTRVVERHRGTAIPPRATLIDQRSMEGMRSFGLEDSE